MDEMPLPEWDITKLREAAVAMHEAFLALKQGGFDEKQALYLVSMMVRSDGPTGEADGH